MEKTGFVTPVFGTLSVAVEVDANGNLVTVAGGQVAAGYKRISINNIDAATDTAEITEEIADVFLKTLPGTNAAATYATDAKTTFTVKWESE